jgi:transcriptional regulator with XRE-family HTH domain
MNVGERIRMIRKSRNMTVKQFAERVGISPSFLSDIENGKSSAPFKRLSAIADKLGISVSSLIGEKDSIPDLFQFLPVNISKEAFLDLIEVKEFGQVLNALEDFKKWSKEDRQELLIYLKAKRIIRNQSS